MGTPEPAVHILKALHDEGHQIALVVTQPDRPKGRGREVAPPPVKVYAEHHKIPVLQPEKVRDAQFIADIKTLQPDVIVVVAYGQILPKELLAVPRFGGLNLHTSLLPKYRGAAPVQWAILKGEKETGVSIFRLEETLDTGPIYAQEKVTIKEYDNTQTLLDKLFREGARLMVKVVAQLEKGTISAINQDGRLATFAPKITKEMGEINWRNSADEIHNQVRGLIPWPGAHTYVHKKTLKIWDTRLAPPIAGKKPGEILAVNGEGIVIACGDGALLIKEVQLEGKERHLACDFANGAHLKPGLILPN